MASGLIPIVVSDHWALPFQDLIDWSKIAVVVREAEAASIPARLANWTLAEVCAARVRVHKAYMQYIKSPAQWVAAIEQIFSERQARAPTLRNATAIRGPRVRQRGETGWADWLRFLNRSRTEAETRQPLDGREVIFQ
eukprot:4272324-Prymnesium_polylepis.1